MTKEEWVDWRDNFVTQAFLEALQDTRDGKKEEIAEGKVEGNQLYVEIGRCQGLKDALDYALRYFHLEEDNAKGSGLPSDSES